MMLLMKLQTYIEGAAAAVVPKEEKNVEQQRVREARTG